jgi:hypothetical protein
VANANVSRLGQANLAGDPQALFLKVASGEVLVSFKRNSAFRQRHTVRTIANGKSAQFPVLGYTTAGYHTPGTEILGRNIRAGEKVIVIDGVLVADSFIADIDEAMNNYDVRAPYMDDMGDALAKAYDQNVARVGIQNARAAATLDDTFGGYTSNNANYGTDGTVLWQGIYGAGVQFDLKDVPTADRSAFVKALQHALLVQSEKPIHFDLNQGANPNGSIALGRIARINDIEIVKTNNLVQADDRANAAIAAQYRADYSPTVALVQQKSAVGTVQLQDVTFASQYDLRRLGTLMIGKYLVGHGGLRPEASAELRTGAPS